MIKQPLTYRLRKGMAKNDPMELQTSRSKILTNQKKPTPVSSRPSFRSSFASLFSFRKPGKETVKLQSLGQKGCDGRVEPPGSARGTAMQAKIHSLPLENQPVDSAFVPTPAVMRMGSGMPPPWDASVLENEFFQVLDDLDSTLAQEQFASSVNTSMPLNYGSRTPFSRSYSSGNRHGNITGTHKHRYNETSNMSIYDILRPGTPREGFKTFSPRTRTICDMYRTREPRILKEDYAQKNTLGSTSLCFDSRQRSASPATRHFTARSLHFPATTPNKSRFVPPSHQQTPKRTPLSSIIWNRSDSFGDRQNQEEFLRAPSPMEMDPADQYMYPRCFQENRRYELYHSQNVFQSASLNALMDNAMSPDAFENSENMPFYYQDNPFARSFFSNTFGQSREQRFGQSSFWNQQKEYSTWSDFHPSRKPFISSDRDFEMISIEANSAPNVHGHSIRSQHWEPFSSQYGTNLFRGQEEPHLWQPDFQTSPPESMEISPGNENQSTSHFGTPNVYSSTGSGYHIKSSELECRQDSSPREVLTNKEPYSFGIAQIPVSSFKNSFSQIPDEQGNSQSPNFQKSTVTLQKIIPNIPETLPIRNHMEDTVTDSNPVDSLSLAKSQPNILVTETNNEKYLTESILEEDKQLNKMDQTNMTGEIPQPGSQTVIFNPLPDSQNSLSQHSTKSNRFNFNAPTKVSSERSPRVFSRNDTSQIYKSHREKANELKKEKSFPGNKLGSTTSLSFTQESRTPPSFLSPNQECHQELTGSEDISNTIKNCHWHSEPTDTQNTQSPEESVISDTEGQHYPTTHSTNCCKLAAGNNSSSSSSGLSSGAPPDSSSSNKSCLDAFVIPSTTVFSRKSPSDKNLFLGEREGKDNTSKKQNDKFAVSPSGNQKSTDSHMPIGDEVVDVVKCHSYSPFRNGKGKGRIRRRISCIEKLSKIENRSIPISEGSSLIEENQSDPKVSELNTIYCTLPRKAASFLINGKQPENKIMAASLRNGPLPFQIKNNVEDPVGKNPSSKFSLCSPESMNECSKVVSDSVPIAPEDTERKTHTKVIRSASVRKGPLPFLIKRAMSCPSGEPCASTGKDERKKPSVADTDTSAVTPRPWERMGNSLESDSSVRDCSLTKRHHLKGFSPECTEKDETLASRTSVFSLSNEDPLPFCAELSGKGSGKMLHKLKTTSTFSVSGDEDNVKCLEVVSIYYTLPRKPSKKFCDLLQRYTQNASPLEESPQVETETFPNGLERDEPNYCPQDLSETPSSEDLKVPVNSAQSHLSHTTENMGVLKLPNRGLSEMASVGTNVCLHKGESRTRNIAPDNLAKTPLGDLQSREEKGGKWQSETPDTSLMLQERNATKEKSEISMNAGDSGPSGLPAHLEDNVENSQTRSSRECASNGRDFIATASGQCPQKDHTVSSVDDCSSGSQPRDVRGKVETDFHKRTDKMLSDSENQVFALISAFHKLQVDEEAHSGKQDLENLESGPRELPQGSQELNITESRKVKDEMQKLAWDQTLLPGTSNKNETDLDNLEKAENKSSVKHRLAAMSKANRKFPTKDLSPRRHVATIFPQSRSKSGFGHLSLGNLECDPLSPEPTPNSTGSTDESCLSNVEKSENPLQGMMTSSIETSSHSCDQKSDNISQLHQKEFQNISESPPKHEKDVTVAQILERESGTPTQPTFTSLREVDFSDHQKRLSPPLPLEPAQKSTFNLSLASYQQQQRSASSLERESEPHLYRSKSLKNISVLGDQLCGSGPPKVRERHFSESTSIDNALSQLTLGNELSTNSGYGRRFKSFSELPSRDENESWALYNSRMKTGPKSASSISRPIDYGIFGKEQQLAFLENVKRSLTQGRLWKPSFLKNPGFLKDDVMNPSNTSESLSSNSPSSQVPKDGLFPNEPLNIYEEDPVDSDCDTDTTTDDEYYLDENDKESEL